MITKDTSKQRLLAIAAIIIIALLGLNAFLIYNKYSQERVIETQRTEILESDRLKIEMEKQYHEALAELEEMRTSNEELNAIIDQQKEELRAQRNKINKLLKEGGNLERAKAEIRNLTIQVSEYTAQIQTLQVENEGLKGENQQLATKSQELTETLESERDRNRELSTDKQQLESTQNKLTQENEQLSDKVNLASVIKVKNISVLGMKEKESGKMVKKRYAKNVEQLRVCFSTEANAVANPGVEKFHIRIISPIGETMAIEDLGAGILVDKSSGQEIRYTSITEHEYENDETEICFNWNPSTSNFQKGNYNVEIYNKGHVAGTGTFELK